MQRLSQVQAIRQGCRTLWACVAERRIRGTCDCIRLRLSFSDNFRVETVDFVEPCWLGSVCISKEVAMSSAGVAGILMFLVYLVGIAAAVGAVWGVYWLVTRNRT